MPVSAEIQPYEIGWGTSDNGTQCLYLDEPEPQQHLRQDLLNGYIIFVLSVFDDGWANSWANS